jgi:hypothetical protein
VQCSHDQWVASSPPRLDPPPLELPTFALPARPFELPEALELLLDLAAPFEGMSTSDRLFSKARTRFSKYVLVTLESQLHVSMNGSVVGTTLPVVDMKSILLLKQSLINTVIELDSLKLYSAWSYRCWT